MNNMDRPLLSGAGDVCAVAGWAGPNALGQEHEAENKTERQSSLQHVSVPPILEVLFEARQFKLLAVRPVALTAHPTGGRYCQINHR